MKKTIKKKAEIDVADLIEEPLPELDDKPKRGRPAGYKKQKESVIGSLFVGVGNLVAGISSAISGVNVPLAPEESQMLAYTGECLEKYGDVDMIDENVGKYAMYLALGSLAFVGISRFMLKKKMVAPAENA